MSPRRDVRRHDLYTLQVLDEKVKAGWKNTLASWYRRLFIQAMDRFAFPSLNQIDRPELVPSV